MREQPSKELINLLKAKDGLIFVSTYEENELIREICQAVLDINKQNLSYKMPATIYTYSRTSGMYKVNVTNPLDYDPGKVEKDVKNPIQALQFIENIQRNSVKKKENLLDHINPDNNSSNSSGPASTPTIFIMKDMHLYFSDKDFIRKLRDLKEEYAAKNGVYCPIIITAPVVEFPPELEKIFTLFEYNLMTKQEIRDNLRDIIYRTNFDKTEEERREELEKISNSCVGLTQREINRAIAHSLAKNNKRIVAEEIYQEKLQIVKKSGALDYVSPEHKLEDLGGCQAFKEWIKKVKEAMTPEAKEFGIPQPKGAMLVGVPGTSKTVSAEILASYLNVPLLSLDMAKVMGSFVGQSERQISNALRIAQAISPCVLLIDEMEKVLGGKLICRYETK